MHVSSIPVRSILFLWISFTKVVFLARTLVPRLEIKSLTKVYDNTKVVDAVSLSVLPGQITCLLGPSGCGKSTTLRMIAGVEPQSSGEVWVDGQMISGHGFSEPPEKRYIGLIFQDFALFPHMTVWQNVAFGITKTSDDIKEKANELLSKVGLTSKCDKFPHELSGGEQQRVALVRALAPRPRIMLMDEPFSGLDKRLRDDIRDETIDILKSEATAVLLVTHEPEEAMKMADEIALMRDGGIVQKGAPYNLYNAPVDREAVAFFSDANIIKSTVNGTLANSQFGQFFAPGLSEGASVEIVIRPQHVRIDFDRDGKGPLPTVSMGIPARGCVERARFLGNESLIEFKMDFDNSIFKVTIPSVFLPKLGQPLWLTIPRDRCFVFAA